MNPWNLCVALALMAFAPLAKSGIVYETNVLVGTLAGNGTPGFANGVTNEAMFNSPRAIAVDAETNVYIWDSANFVIRKITSSGTVSTLAGLVGVQGRMDGPPDRATFASLVGLTASPDGNLYVGDQWTIRRVEPNGTVSTIAGTGVSPGYVDGPSSQARFGGTLYLGADNLGNLFIGDAANRRLRKLDTNGTVSTLAGSGLNTFNDGTGTNAGLPGLRELTVASSGNIFFSDTCTIRRFRPSDAAIITLCGGPDSPQSVDGTGPAARFVSVRGLAPDIEGNLFALDLATTNVLRRIWIPGAAVTTLAGAGTGFNDGDGQVALFYSPRGLAIGPNGLLYVSDTFNHRIRTVRWRGWTPPSTNEHAAEITAGRYLGLNIEGTPGRLYRIEYVTDLTQTNQWATAATVMITNTPTYWFDLESLSAPQRYYRAVLVE